LILLLAAPVFIDESLGAAYRTETEHLTAERLPLGLALCLGLIGVVGLADCALAPDHLRVFAAAGALALACTVPLLLGQRGLMRRGWLSRANVAAWCILAALVQAYAVGVGLSAETGLVIAVCVSSAAALLLPWGLPGQGMLVAVSTAAAIVALLSHAGAAVAVPVLIVAAVAAGAISLFGAYYFDLHRFALFVETSRREEEAAVSHTLVAIAREINDALEADDGLDRIAAVIRSALHATWTAVVLRDASRDVCTVVGAAGRAPDAIAALRGVEFHPIAMPLIARVLADHELVATGTALDPAIAGLMQRTDTRSLLGSVLLRRNQVVGVLLAGAERASTGFSDRGREICRGIAQHVAIALNNIGLIADLRRANALKSEFLSTMSHELRTPLNVIMGYADLLHDDAFGPLLAEQRDVLGRLRSNARSLLELISATLEVNRLEAGRNGVQLREVELRTLLVELCTELEQLPRHAGVALRWELPRSADVVRTDPTKLKIVLRNLVGNALKFTRRGAVTLQVGIDARTRTIDAVVRDTGAGIDADHLPKIFEMFHQAPGGDQAGGVGLGLYIVHRFVELLGGRVSVSSTVGEGSVFRVSLPTGIAAQPVSIEAHRRRRRA
jgi:signal transduction histidine kinase